MDIYDPRKFRSSRVSEHLCQSRPSARIHGCLDLRFSEKRCDRFKNVRIALVGIIEPRSVNKHDSSAIQNELSGFLNLGCARIKVFPHFEVRPACLVHELQLCPSELVTKRIRWKVLSTVVFPLPVTPITLNQTARQHFHNRPSFHMLREAGYSRNEHGRVFGAFQERVIG